MSNSSERTIEEWATEFGTIFYRIWISMRGYGALLSVRTKSSGSLLDLNPNVGAAAREARIPSVLPAIA